LSKQSSSALGHSFGAAFNVKTPVAGQHPVMIGQVEKSRKYIKSIESINILWYNPTGFELSWLGENPPSETPPFANSPKQPAFYFSKCNALDNLLVLL
jgi:hypothetical protein